MTDFRFIQPIAQMSLRHTRGKSKNQTYFAESFLVKARQILCQLMVLPGWVKVIAQNVRLEGQR